MSGVASDIVRSEASRPMRHGPYGSTKPGITKLGSTKPGIPSCRHSTAVAPHRPQPFNVAAERAANHRRLAPITRRDLTWLGLGLELGLVLVLGLGLGLG